MQVVYAKLGLALLLTGAGASAPVAAQEKPVTTVQKAPAPPEKEPTPEEMEVAEKKRLLGTWQGWVVDGKGERPDRGPIKVAELIITEKSIQGRDDKLSFGDGTYRLDLSQNPRYLDSTGLSGQVKGYKFTGIYELDGDTLKWCVANPGKPRPTEMRTRPAIQFYMILKRVPKEAVVS